MKFFDLLKVASLLSLFVVFALTTGCTRQAPEEDMTEDTEAVMEEPADVMEEAPDTTTTMEEAPAEEVPAEEPPAEEATPPAN